MYIPNNSKLVKAGEVLNWSLVDGKKELPIRLQIMTTKTPKDGFAITLGRQTRLPRGVKIESTGVQNYRGRRYWPKSITLVLVHRRKHYILFYPQDTHPAFPRLYFTYLPEEFGGVPIVYSESQFLE